MISVCKFELLMENLNSSFQCGHGDDEQEEVIRERADYALHVRLVPRYPLSLTRVNGKSDGEQVSILSIN